MRLAFVILLVAFGFAGRADAAVNPPTDRPVSQAFVSTVVQIAERFYGRAPCAPRVFFSSGAQLAAAGDLAPGLPFPLAATPAGPETACVVWLSDRLMGGGYRVLIDACSALVHELGHRLGFGHDDREHPGSVMNSRLPAVYGCYRRFLPRGKGRAWRSHNPFARWALKP